MKRIISKYIGPGPLVAAAFIGPGTVTVCSLAGVNFGLDLLWALGLSIIATVSLQEMAARIGLVSQNGLAGVISQTLRKGPFRYFSLLLILTAIVLGNAAYEAGNISGGVMGLDLFFQVPVIEYRKLQINVMNLMIGLAAWILLIKGTYQKITKVLTVLVILMSLAFLINAALVRPSIRIIFQGFIPRIDQNNILQIVALIGTTVVPYNLFLHSSLVAKKWHTIKDLGAVRLDTVVSVVLGGLVSIAIVITAAGSGVQQINSALELAVGIEPLLGALAKYFMGFGLFAAGITSAITAPLAGAFVVTGIFGWSAELNQSPMRWCITGILGLGLLFASLGIKPVQLINLAQFANGLLLPLLSAYILWLANKSSLMNKQSNTLVVNFFGIGVWIITLLLGGMSIGKVMGWI
ncbi:Manganese transport protein MntH [Indibacter alkaliphilus LW1]|uniref:Manganese transport protein MntH n=1 Tax=Indibacter alkaliphilus (strain CCUG 57479 / KCTC 22604 / LW1) TaxID=1189612 RepID=S2DHT4_INDAL|nr:divalent metal cation transporter [Indibacter alkaliphilus]EOZ98567.1 Manganese transport protein MntH [Indibacter alkaliphilus LW1]